MEIGLHPRMAARQHISHGTNYDNLAVPQYRDTVTGRMQAVEVVGYHKHGQP